MQLAHRKVAAVAALGALTLGAPGAAGCGDDEPAGRTERSGAPRLELEPRAWQRAVPARGGRLLRIFYLTGPAFRLERVRVAQAPGTVTVTLLERPPGPGPQSAVGEIRCQQVRLSRPLADRRIIDGATGRAPRDEGAARPRPAACRPPLTR